MGNTRDAIEIDTLQNFTELLYSDEKYYMFLPYKNGKLEKEEIVIDLSGWDMQLNGNVAQCVMWNPEYEEEWENAFMRIDGVYQDLLNKAVLIGNFKILKIEDTEDGFVMLPVTSKNELNADILEMADGQFLFKEAFRGLLTGIDVMGVTVSLGE